MTKKDYEKAATIVQEFAQAGDCAEERHANAMMVFAFVVFFKRDGNPRFDEDRFRRACVVGANVRARG